MIYNADEVEEVQAERDRIKSIKKLYAATARLLTATRSSSAALQAFSIAFARATEKDEESP